MALGFEQELPAIISFATARSFALDAFKVRARADFKAAFEEHRHRVYSLAFWMTDNEITAEEISTRTFLRAFKSKDEVTQQTIDRSLITELRELTSIGRLTLNVKADANHSVIGKTKRIDLERAVVRVPATERLAFLLHDVEGYSHEQVARTLSISEEESRRAVIQARILIREIVAQKS